MKKVLLGNEAIVQGALEAGVQFVSAYPGTPSSEVGMVFGKIAKKQAYTMGAINLIGDIGQMAQMAAMAPAGGS